MISIPVHVWLPGCADPANAGVLEVDDRSVSFTYGADYLTAGGPPIVGELPARRARHRQWSSGVRSFGAVGSGLLFCKKADRRTMKDLTPVVLTPVVLRSRTAWVF
jgi:hypothetical protein